ncbi:hypothetical protein E4U14_001941 [Claviceps sp. LM454 group G7]|nr:hypothetical protein E4U14_001941 [Claviceps sp. LM454 group G7]
MNSIKLKFNCEGSLWQENIGAGDASFSAIFLMTWGIVLRAYLDTDDVLSSGCLAANLSTNGMASTIQDNLEHETHRETDPKRGTLSNTCMLFWDGLKSPIGADMVEGTILDDIEFETKPVVNVSSQKKGL